MPTTTTTRSRIQMIEPDENHDGGTLLHGRVSTLRELMGDAIASRYYEFTGIADSATVETNHNLGANLSQLKVLIYTGTGTTKSIVNDSTGAGWTIAEKAGDEKTILEITAPSSGGPHTFSVVVLDANQFPHAIYQKLASVLGAAPADTIKVWFDDNDRGLAINQLGQIMPTNSLRQLHVSSSFNAVPGTHYLVDTSGGAVTATLPATIQNYDAIQFSDATKSFNSNNLTIARNGNSIDSSAADLVLSTPGDGALLIGSNAASNWIRASSGGAGGSGTGEGDINYVINGSAENDLNDVTASAVTLAAESGSPLIGSQSFGLTSQASTGTVDWDLNTLDNFIIDGGIALELRAYAKDNAGSGSDGDWKIGIYNTTDAVYEVEQNLVTADENIVSGLIFIPVTGKTYVVRVERTTNTASDELLVDRIRVTPDGAGGTIPQADINNFGLVKDKIKVQYQRGTALSLPIGATAFDFDTSVFDNSGGAVTTGAAWEFESPKDAYYLIVTNIAVQSAAWLLGENQIISLWVDTGGGFAFDRIMRFNKGITSFTTEQSLHGSTGRFLNAGEKLQVRWDHTRSGACTSIADATTNWITIFEQ